MDPTEHVDDGCPKDPFNPLVTTIVQVSCMLVIAHIFHLIFKPLGQPGPISQILAGLVFSPTLLSRIDKVREFFIQDASSAYYRIFAFVSRTLFMFLIGLKMDVPYFRLNLRVAGTIAFAGIIMSIIFGVAIALIFMRHLEITVKLVSFFILVIILLANSASPVVIRVIEDLKFDTSEQGRLAISTSLINEMSCVIVYCVFVVFTSLKMFRNAFFSLLLTGALVIVNKYMTVWIGTWNKNSRYVTNAQIVVVLSLMIGVSVVIDQVLGYNSTIICFLLGMMFPRQGRTTRTLFKKLTYSIHDFILPIYFGYMGFQFDADDLNSVNNALLVLVIVLLSIGSKVIGVLAACHHLKIPHTKGILLAFILNLKGNFELLLLEIDTDSLTWFSNRVHNLLLMTVVLNTVISGPVVAFILKRKEQYFAHNTTTIEPLDQDSELRVLACAYEPRHASGQLVLFAAFSGSKDPYLMHLVELPKKRRKNKLMYNQLEDGGQFSDEEEYGGNDVLEINDAVDVFTVQTKMRIHQIKIVNSYANMYEDVCSAAEDLRVSIILLHFHKHQRIDKNLETGKEGYRATNQKILRHAPCTVGLFVHRNQTGFHQPIGFEKLQHVAMLFFGGPDDREALACSKRIANNSNIKLTLIRFVLAQAEAEASTSTTTELDDASPPVKHHEFSMSFRRIETETEKDNTFIEDFSHRHIRSGQVSYMEKSVKDGAETLVTLREIGNMEYSLFIVGKGGHGRSPMTTCMSDWEECPELGSVGDLLASTDFDLKSSVLIIQRHRQYSERAIVNA